jgi:prepilin-type N-terminal cleavage/methylation domain-containing protein
MSKQHPRRGFSLIELIVVIAMLLFLAGLLLPAVQNLRQAGYKAETINNLKQICLAIHNVNDTYRRLPPACDKFANFKFEAPVHVYLFPFIEQVALYKAYDEAGGKGEPAEVLIGVYRAGEDGSATGDKLKGVQNYAANLRVFADSGMKTDYNKNMPALKAVEPGSARIPATFTDGTANTIVFATKIASCGEGGSKFAADPSSKFAAFFGQNAAQKQAHASDDAATYQLQPEAKDCKTSPLMAQAFAKTLLIGLADGSIRGIDPKMSAETWNRALCPRDGMPLGDDW